MSCLFVSLSNELSLYLVPRPINIEEGSEGSHNINKVISLVLIFSVLIVVWGDPRPHPPPAQQV